MYKQQEAVAAVVRSASMVPAIRTVVTEPPPVRHLAIESSRWPRDVRGIGRYFSILLPRIATLRPGLRFTLFCANGKDRATLEARLAASAALQGRAEVRPLRELRRTDAEVFWYPWNAIIHRPTRGAIVVTVHDVAPLAFPDPRWTRVLRNLRWRGRYREVARRATLIVAVSNFTAHEMERLLGVRRGRLHVIPLGGDDGVLPDPARDAEALERLGVRRPFVLAVGAADRRKNVAMLQRAMQLVHARVPAVTLVWAGPRKASRTERPLPPWEHAAGFVSDEDLWTLYRRAEVFVMPSRYEGFGLPVLEAMRVGTPVVSSDAASLTEVGGAAAQYVSADDAAGMANAICGVLGDASRAQAMRDTGFAQVARFTWAESARRTLAVFDAAAQIANRHCSVSASYHAF